jgi:hypothetical protein
MSRCLSVSIKVAKHIVFFTRGSTSRRRERRVGVTVRRLKTSKHMDDAGPV